MTSKKSEYFHLCSTLRFWLFWNTTFWPIFKRGTHRMHTTSFKKFSFLYFTKIILTVSENSFSAQILKDLVLSICLTTPSLLFSALFVGFCGKQKAHSLCTRWFPPFPPTHTAFLSLLKGGNIHDLHNNEIQQILKNFIHNLWVKILICFTEWIDWVFQKQFSYLKMPDDGLPLQETFYFEAFICCGNTNCNLTGA